MTGSHFNVSRKQSYSCWRATLLWWSVYLIWRLPLLGDFSQCAPLIVHQNEQEATFITTLSAILFSTTLVSLIILIIVFVKLQLIQIYNSVWWIIHPKRIWEKMLNANCSLQSYFSGDCLEHDAWQSFLQHMQHGTFIFHRNSCSHLIHIRATE